MTRKIRKEKESHSIDNIKLSSNFICFIIFVFLIEKMYNEETKLNKANLRTFIN